MATKEEQLDEMLAMARECGSLANELARWEHEVESYGPRTWRGKNARHFVKKARTEHETATRMLEKSRARFLASL